MSNNKDLIKLIENLKIESCQLGQYNTSLHIEAARMLKKHNELIAELAWLWPKYKRAKGNLSANQSSVERFEDLLSNIKNL